MSEERTPYGTDRPGSDAACSLRTGNVRRVTRPLPITPEADAVTILARENHDLKQSCAELRRILLALVEEIEYQDGPISRPDIELQIQDARQVLAKAGLL